MCGIAGWIDFNENLKNKIEVMRKMGECLAPRGPDEDGFYCDHSCCLVHRRLTVIDPENGKQPMTKGNYTICYNGELYNTAELQRELEGMGFVFRGHSDTEVLLCAYSQWGEGCLERLNGIFAFAVWDSEKRKLFLARDRAGVKPLYYSLTGGALVFASEPKALLKYPKVRPLIDEGGIAQIMLLGPAVRPDSGIFKDIQQLPPGFFMVFKKGAFSINNYWAPFAEKHTETIEETAEHLSFLIKDSITRQLISDMPLCTFLSGGLDSSIISAVASKNYKTLYTYSIDYVNNRENFKASLFQPDEDAPWIVKMSEHIESRHKNVIIDTSELIEALYESAEARDAPGMADVDSSLYLFCKEVKRDFRVALSGECADEIFGGYPWFKNEEMLSQKGFPWNTATKERYDLIREDLRTNFSSVEYVENLACETEKRTSFLDSDTLEEKKMRKMFMLNFYWFMQTLLTRKDRCSMAHGLEVRVPFCDHRIVQYAYNIPSKIKFYKDREKGIVRLAAENILPKDIAWRKKSPYPKTHNPNYLKRILEIFNELIKNPDCRLYEIMDRSKLHSLCETEGRAFSKNWYGQLMSAPQMFAYLIQLEHWMRKYDVAIVR